MLHARSAAWLTVLALVGAVTPAAIAPSPASAQPAPTDRLQVGAYVDSDNAWTSSADALADVARFEDLVGRGLDIDHHFYSLRDAFPTALEEADVAAGRTPLITWEPWGTNLAEIAAGVHDDLIRQRARDVAAFDEDVFLRFAHEMNGNWYPWAGATNGDAATGPERYRRAWRRVHDLFAQEGAHNAAFVWSVNEDSVPDEPWNSWDAYYPGDDVVDWVAIDAYNSGRTAPDWNTTWREADPLLRRFHDTWNGRKPIMVSEIASAEGGGDKAAWIRGLADSLGTLPGIRALVWFHVPKERDWRVDSSAASLDAFRDLLERVHGPASVQPSAWPDACPTEGTTFADVPVHHTHRLAIGCLAAWGLVSGTGDGAYTPDAHVTRGQLSSILAGLVDRTGRLPEAGSDPFTDDDGSVHEPSIDRLAAFGVLRGRGDGTVGPDDRVTRGQAASLLAATLEQVEGVGLPAADDPFVDTGSSTHRERIAQLTSEGLVRGRDATHFAPDDAVTRGQVATMLAGVLQRLVAAGHITPTA